VPKTFFVLSPNLKSCHPLFLASTNFECPVRVWTMHCGSLTLTLRQLICYHWVVSKIMFAFKAEFPKRKTREPLLGLGAQKLGI